ncbi:hypothetical protein B566_EDAN016976, partial [Ephemera danica]
MSWCAKFKRNLCNAQFCVLVTKTLLLIVLYNSLSIGLTFYQKKFVQDFNYPLTVVLCHMIIKFLMAWTCRAIYECKTGKERPVLAWYNYATRLFPTGATGGLDIGLSNWGLELITISLYTMTKTTSIIFIMGFSLMFKLERKSWSLFMIVFMISCGLFLFTFHATQFHLGGFLLVLTASLLSGLRWTLAQFVMQKSKLGLGNPIDMVYHVQPWMIATVLPFAVTIEGLSLASTHQAFRFEHWSTLAHTIGSVMLGATIAFLMEVAEFLVVSDICSFILAAHWNGDTMSGVNAIGLLLCLGGIVFHVIHKVLHPPPPPEEEIEDATDEIHLPLLDSSNNIMLLHDALSIGKSSDEEDEDVIFSVLNRPG